MSNRHLYVLALLLTALGLGFFLYKVVVVGVPLSRDATVAHWNVEARINFVAGDGPIKATLYVPQENHRFPVFDASYISHDYGLTHTDQGGQVQAVWSIQKAQGPQTLFFRSRLRDLGTGLIRPEALPEAMQTIRLDELEREAAKALLARLRGRSADNETLTALLLKSFNRSPMPENLMGLVGPTPTRSRKFGVALSILGMAKIPAREVHGVELADQRRKAHLIHWIEIWEKGKWLAFNPSTGRQGIPSTFMPWYTGPDALVTLSGGKKLEVQLSVAKVESLALAQAANLGGAASLPALRFSLFSLPISSQLVYRILLMVPVGAFLLVLLRNVVGLKTFGTFMPVLIALAFRETHLGRGVLLFTLVVALGLGVRFYMERLKLLLVPRLAAVLTIVVLLMAAMSVVGHQLGLEGGLSVALFPMVVLTMTIERMSVLWDERGASEAMKQGVGSMAAAVIAYLVMVQPALEHLVFTFPELLLVLLAAILLLGRYSGYRLVELPRFRALAKEGG